MGISIGPLCKIHGKKKDQARLLKAERCHSQASKETQTASKYAETRQEHQEEAEGLLYGPH